MDWAKLLIEWGAAGMVLVVVWFFIQYIKARDQDRREDANLFISQLNKRDDQLTKTLDRNTEVIAKLDKNIDHLNIKIEAAERNSNSNNSSNNL